MFHILSSQHPAHTHTYSSIYFPPLFRFTGIILPSQWWSTPLSSCHTIQFKTIVSYPLCARHWAYSHPFSESSWSGVILDSAQYLTQKFDHKIPSILPLKYHPKFPRFASFLPSHGSGPPRFSARKMQQSDVPSGLHRRSISTPRHSQTCSWTHAKTFSGSTLSTENSLNFRQQREPGPSLPWHFQVSGTPAVSPPPVTPPPKIIVPVHYWILII